MPIQNDKKSTEEEYVEEKKKELIERIESWEPALIGQNEIRHTVIKNFIRTIRNDCKVKVSEGWLPTVENINALPEPVRRYIHDIETNCDPPSLVRENIVLKENLKASEMSNEKIFVQHIENHLKQMGIKGKVVCKICEKDIDKIASEEGVEVEK